MISCIKWTVLGIRIPRNESIDHVIQPTIFAGNVFRRLIHPVFASIVKNSRTDGSPWRLYVMTALSPESASEAVTLRIVISARVSDGTLCVYTCEMRFSTYLTEKQEGI